MKMMLSESIRDELSIKLIDITEDMELATNHQVMNVPTFVVLENGVEISRKIGATTIDQLKNM